MILYLPLSVPRQLKNSSDHWSRKYWRDGGVNDHVTSCFKGSSGLQWPRTKMKFCGRVCRELPAATPARPDSLSWYHPPLVLLALRYFFSWDPHARYSLSISCLSNNFYPSLTAQLKRHFLKEPPLDPMTRSGHLFFRGTP